MIENIKNPPTGFQSVIKRHFYLKKDEILQDVERWVKYSQKRDASYSAIVNDHNSTWSAEFKKSKTKYQEMLVTAINELKQEL